MGARLARLSSAASSYTSRSVGDAVDRLAVGGSKPSRPLGGSSFLQLLKVYRPATAERGPRTRGGADSLHLWEV